MKYNRSAGILLHPTCLPGPYGIGDIGPAAYRWVDWLASTGCKIWQILPLGPTGYGDSPYQCFSAFAGNPYLISPELLLMDGYLHARDLDEMPEWDSQRVDFGTLCSWKPMLLEKAFQRFEGLGREKNEFEAFCKSNAGWVDDYALFMAIKDECGGGSWLEWPAELRSRDETALDQARTRLINSIRRFCFYQYIFHRQWLALRKYANERKVSIIGDIPIFVAMDSSDVWSHPNLFHLTEDGKPAVVAGVPPDYFSPTGQLWGNPLYRWELHSKSRFSWWKDRIRSTLDLVDIIRIDHFRGFAGYWEIPGDAKTAERGQWLPGPGARFFNEIKTAFDELPIIAEDLGEITPDVIELREQFSLPGMKILQFAFSGPDNPFLPHHYVQNSIVYTGTHDNNTSRGWFEAAPANEIDFARRYFGRDWETGADFTWDLIRAAWSSVPAISIAPLQDFLGLGSEARFNYPSRLGGNWEWRALDGDFDDDLKNRILDLNWLYHR